ncbi:MAG TPA: hypothetical protein VNG32_04070 [Candidatus Dormibacteraeota bacterium]|nr:hypothetical protein [Candidatus Dormibacteraeota bacterium]
MYGLEKNFSFTPQTHAGQLMQSRTQGDSSIASANVPNTDEPLPMEVTSQTNPDLAGATTAVPLGELLDEVEVYSHDSDEVFEAPGNYTSKLFCWVARSALIPSVHIKHDDHGNRAKLTIALWYQKPSVTALDAYDRSREVFQESEEVLQESGNALLETIKETYGETKAKPDKESASAIAIVCMQLVNYYSQYENTDSRRELTNAIRLYHPDILKDPQFGTTMKRFGKDPEKFKKDFSSIPNLEAMIEALPMVPAFHEFTEAHGINTEVLFGGVL